VADAAGSMTEDVAVREVVVGLRPIVEASETSKARSRLSKSIGIAGTLHACQHCRTILLRKRSVDLWVVGFVGCGLLTILLRQLWALRSYLWA
jgi:hypothetical protein